jgi:ferredoxin
MRVVVDRDLCQGHAMCALEAPGVFEVGAGDDQVRLLTESPGETERDAVLNAVRYCPNAALSIEETGS